MNDLVLILTRRKKTRQIFLRLFSILYGKWFICAFLGSFSLFQPILPPCRIISRENNPGQYFSLFDFADFLHFVGNFDILEDFREKIAAFVAVETIPVKMSQILVYRIFYGASIFSLRPTSISIRGQKGVQ